jgi:hypothetical protein
VVVAKGLGIVRGAVRFEVDLSRIRVEVTARAKLGKGPGTAMKMGRWVVGSKRQ